MNANGNPLVPRSAALHRRTAPLRTAWLRAMLFPLVIISGCGRHDIPAALPAAVQVVTLAQEQVACRTQISATVRERRAVDLSFKVPGTVKQLLQVRGADGTLRDVQEGDVVNGDLRQPLAQLDDADCQRQRSAAAERLAQARAKEQAVAANLTAAEAEYRRLKELRDERALADQAHDAARARRDAFQAVLAGARREVAAANVALQQAEDDLRNCSLCVPLPQATIARKLVEPNERVQAARTVLQVMDLSQVRVAFGVPDTKIAEFCLGQSLKIVADAFPGESFAGRVTKLYPAADPKTRTVEVEVTVDEPRGLKPGMVVTILNGCEETMLLLPMTSIQRGEKPGEFAVYTVNEEQERQVVRRRRVHLDGVYDNRIRVAADASSELKAGDTVVVCGGSRLTDGQAVRVLPGREQEVRVQL